jgi:hypothetical protein
MNSIVLVLSVFVLGKLNGSRFAEYWRWMGTPANLNPVKDIYISRGTSISQSIGFAILGLAASYPGVITGKSNPSFEPTRPCRPFNFRC